MQNTIDNVLPGVQGADVKAEFAKMLENKGEAGEAFLASVAEHYKAPDFEHSAS